MFEKLEIFVNKWTDSSNPWTNVYGVARSLLALSTLLTLLINDVHTFFRPAAGINSYPLCQKGDINLFCMVSADNLEIARWIAIIILIIVVSGWRPQITGVLHWFIAYSFQNSAIGLDGGEQVCTVLTLLLLPITLTDKRKWHWSINEDVSNNVYIRLIALSAYVAIRIQVAIIYFHAGLAKLFKKEWIDGTAVYYYLEDTTFGLNAIQNELFHPVLSSAFVVIPTWGTIILEFLLFSALFAPKKYWKPFLIGGFMLHFFIALMLGLISFSMIMFAALILFLRPINQPFGLLKPEAKTVINLIYPFKKFISNKSIIEGGISRKYKGSIKNI